MFIEQRNSEPIRVRNFQDEKCLNVKRMQKKKREFVCVLTGHF